MINKILFIVINEESQIVYKPLGVAYIISFLRQKNYTVDIAFCGMNDYEGVINKISVFCPDLVAIPVLQYCYDACINISKHIKDYDTNILITLGNIIPTLYGEDIMKECSSIDYIIVNEAEEAFIELLKILNNHEKRVSLDNCFNLIYRNKCGDIIKTKNKKPTLCLDNYPFPDRAHYNNDTTIYGVIGSRGCVSKCSFCDANIISNNYYRVRTISNILDEVDVLINTTNCKYIEFYDSTFCSSNSTAISRLEELHFGLLSKNFKICYSLNIRPEQLTKTCIETLSMMTNSGLSSIQVGFEAGNQSDLILYNKNTTINQYVHTLNLLKEKGILDLDILIDISYGFINFNPYTTREKLLENALFLQNSGLFVNFSNLVNRLALSGGANIYLKIKNDGLLLKEKDIKNNPFCYRFLYNDIENLYDILNYCYLNFNEKINRDLLLVHIYCASMSLANYEMLNKIVNYKKIFTEFAVKCFLYIINSSKLYDRFFLIKNLDKYYKDFLESNSNIIGELCNYQRRLFIEMNKKGIVLKY